MHHLEHFLKISLSRVIQEKEKPKRSVYCIGLFNDLFKLQIAR